jgi:prepilin-type N-terminal cleavage/methylation domain-containing protein
MFINSADNTMQKQCLLQTGFTLFELLVVLLIMSVSLGLFLGFNFRQQESIQLQGQGHAVAQLMRAAKSTAIVRGESNACFYDPKTATVSTSLDQREHTLSATIELRINDTSVEEKVELAVFYPDGAAETENITLRSAESGQTVTIHIDPLFGDIQLAGQ